MIKNFAILLAALVMATVPRPTSAAAALADLASLEPVMSCASLGSQQLDRAVGAQVSALIAVETAGAAPYCKVTGTIAPAIRFEVRLPLQGWTQRFLQTGCGGLCGMLSIRPEMMRDCAPVTDGRIVLASTDMGHQGMDMAWAADPRKREDFAHRGVHLTALAAKALTAAFYGQAPRYSYFAGCSDGGREALIAAQRYPGDFDGISAGAPALNFTVQNSFYHAWQALSNRGPDGRALLGPVDMPVLHRAALRLCDARDGLNDGQITDPRSCRFDPAVTLCKVAYEAGQCLTAAQVEAARKLYLGPRDQHGRKLTVGGPVPGSEGEWPGVFVPRQAGGALFSERIVTDSAKLLQDPARSYRLEDIAITTEAFGAMAPARALYNADSPGLAAFSARGGRLIMWHGWNDQHISPYNSIDYYERVGRAMGNKSRADMMRLFMLPAVGHCKGSDGPDDLPLLQALMAWVERGQAPQVLIARRSEAQTAGQLSPRSRPVFPYPQIAAYKGRGSVDEAGNFAARQSRSDGPIDWIGARR